jgi:hypothetical protein
MPTAVRASILAVGIVAAALLSGCGSSGSHSPAASPPSKPPAGKTLASQTISAFRNASSVRVTGWAVDKGTRIFVDMAMTRSGGLSGSMAERSKADQFVVLDTGRKVYFKFTPGFVRLMKAPSVICTLMCGKWLLATPSMTRGFLRSFGWSKVFGQLTHIPGSLQGLTVHGPVLINSVKAWVITNPGHKGTMYVAAQGTPYLLRFTMPGHGGGSIDFTDWNSAKIPPPPPASDVINMSQLSKLG